MGKRMVWLPMLLVWGLCGSCSSPRTVVIVQQTQPSSLDPHWTNETVVWSTLSNVVEGLVRFSPQLELEPALAVRWQQEGPTVWRFTLRSGVLFHHGKPLTAQDVVASFQRAQRHPRSQVSHFLSGVTRVEAVGDGEVLLVTDGPAPTLLRRLSFVLVLPEEQCGDEEVLVPLGTGPYRVTEREDHALELQATRWWGGQVSLRRARMIFVEDDTERTRLFAAGEADVATWLREADVAELRRHPELRVKQQPRLSVQLLAIIPRAASGEAARALADVRVRRALHYALNRQRLVEEVARGEATVASQLVHPLVFGYDPTLEPLPYDPGKARQLLAQAGVREGLEVTLGIAPGAVETGERIAQDWAQVGVRVSLKVLSFSELLAATRAGRLPVVFFARTCTTSDASEVLEPHTHCPDPPRGLGVENYPQLCDPQVDRLLEAAATELDLERRRKLLQQAQKRVLEHSYYLPLLIRWSYLGLRKPLDVQPRYDQFLFLPNFALTPER
ncbi:MAG: ABC transporter substrate-binding protein [Thermoanaerobaculum sp.]|nr:ABC transporter substrate-binding protein [Thermoanaerobaculum sp.]